MSTRLIQDLHAGISRRDWNAVEAAANRLRDDIEETRRVLAGTGIGSLPNDYPLSRLATEALETYPASTALVERLGWKLVPLVPTQEMIDAWRMDQAQGRSLQSSYSAMIAAEAELDSRTRELDKTEIELRALVDALTEAEPYVELCHSLMTQKETRANVWRVLKQVRSALKSKSPSSDRAASEGSTDGWLAPMRLTEKMLRRMIDNGSWGNMDREEIASQLHGTWAEARYAAEGSGQ